jgi:hypothetical protein
MPATATPSRLSLGRVGATPEARDALHHANTHPSATTLFLSFEY